VEQPAPRTAGWWHRAAAILARSALEAKLAILLASRGADPRDITFTAQLILLSEVVPDPLAGRVAATWAQLSSACHQHDEELPPTADELRAWFEAVEELIRAKD
jgi:hypothetical protein